MAKKRMKYFYPVLAVLVLVLIFTIFYLIRNMPKPDSILGPDSDSASADSNSSSEKTWTKEDIEKLKKGIQPVDTPKGPVAELCNGLDDDLDGVIDEQLTQSCGSSEVGACQFGTMECANGLWGSCQNNIAPRPEICNNNLDDDCDSTVDEDCMCIVFFRNSYNKQGSLENEFLLKLKSNKYPALTVKEYVVPHNFNPSLPSSADSSNENLTLLNKYKAKLSIKFDYLPLTFIGSEYIKGFGSETTTGKEILNLLDKYKNSGCE